MPNRPNILLIMTDQQRYDSLGYMHQEQTYTPFLDRLARQGTIFTHAYSSSTACVPARTSLLTGVLPNRMPLVPNGFALQEGAWTIARGFKAAGYETALYGKLHAKPMHADHGFDFIQLAEHLTAGYGRDAHDDFRTWLESTGRSDVRFEKASKPRVYAYPEEFHPTAWITRNAMSFLEKRNGKKPYFAVVSYAHPHTPYDPPARYAAMYAPEHEPPPHTDFSVNHDMPPAFWNAANDSNPRGFFVPLRTDNAAPGHVAAVKAAIRALNRQISDAVEQLMSRVDLTNTLVFFLSDHGDYGGERGFLAKIPWIPFDDLARVPFFMVGAGVPSGRMISEPIQSFDYVATALASAGIAYPYANVDAVDLAAYYHCNTAYPDRVIYSETLMGFPMVLRRGLKHLWHEGTGDHLLYDMHADPLETTNVASRPEHTGLLQENETLIRAVYSAPKIA